MSTTTATDLTMTLAEARFIDLTTFRRSGEPVSTPVLLIPDGDRLLVRTAAGSGKLKRIGHSPRVEVTPCDQRGRHLGPTAGGTATILGPEAVGPTLARLHARYRIAGPLFSLVRRLRRQPDVIVEIALDVPMSRPAPASLDIDDVARARAISGVTAALAAALLMGACSSTAAPTVAQAGDPATPASTAEVVLVDSGGGTVDTSDGAAVCAIVPRTAIEGLLGVALADGVATDQGMVSGASCRYASQDGDTRVAIWVHQPLTRADWDGSMAKLGMDEDEPVAGLGEAALIHGGTPLRPRARLSAFEADHDVWVDITGAPDQDAATAAVQTLARQVLTALAR